MEKQEKQLWVNVEKQIRKFYPKDYNESDIEIAKAFFKAGFNVYPESGYMFQKITQFGDGSYNEASLDIDEARIIVSHLSTFAEQKEHNNSSKKDCSLTGCAYNINHKCSKSVKYICEYGRRSPS